MNRGPTDVYVVVYGTALPEDARPAGLEEYPIHPAVLDREG